MDEGYVTIENNKTGVKTDVNINDFIEVLKKFEELRKKKISIEDIVLQNNFEFKRNQDNIVKTK